MENAKTVEDIFNRMLKKGGIHEDISRDCIKTYAQTQMAIALTRIADMMEAKDETD